MNIQRNKRSKDARNSHAVARMLSYDDSTMMDILVQSRICNNFINESSMTLEAERTKRSSSSRSTELSNISLEERRFPSTLDSSHFYLRGERHSTLSVHEITNHDEMSTSEHPEKEEENLNETVYGDRQLDILIQQIDEDYNKEDSQNKEQSMSFNLRNVFDE